MISVRLTFHSGNTHEKTFSDFDEMTNYIKEVKTEQVETMEVDVESSDYNRPAFWRTE